MNVGLLRQCVTVTACLLRGAARESIPCSIEPSSTAVQSHRYTVPRFFFFFLKKKNLPDKGPGWYLSGVVFFKDQEGKYREYFAWNRRT